MKQILRHKSVYSTMLLLGIYVVHIFLLNNFLTHFAQVQNRAQYHAHVFSHRSHHRHSEVGFFRMLEKHDGSKQSIALPADGTPIPSVRVEYRITDLNVKPVDFTDWSRLSPSSYRLYLRDRVFLI
ncbi:MAG: hypothetical protein JST90_07815 [Bacteroidetes bacterium]|nr:hypothetical protein [Bacteroidota bacterium]